MVCQWTSRRAAPSSSVSEVTFHLRFSETTITLALDVERAFHPCNISSKETNDRGENYHEGDRGDGPGGGNGRDEAGGAARAAGSDKRRRRSGACVGIHLG